MGKPEYHDNSASRTAQTLGMERQKAASTIKNKRSKKRTIIVYCGGTPESTITTAYAYFWRQDLENSVSESGGSSGENVEKVNLKDGRLVAPIERRRFPAARSEGVTGCQAAPSPGSVEVRSTA